MHFIGIALVEEQEEELATLINTIDQSKGNVNTLNELLSEAEKVVKAERTST